MDSKRTFKHHSIVRYSRLAKALKQFSPSTRLNLVIDPAAFENLDFRTFLREVKQPSNVVRLEILGYTGIIRFRMGSLIKILNVETLNWFVIDMSVFLTVTVYVT
jgi:hypothetical protein